jgi:NAD(P)-dependent dehydrogenase (short-subunit alcohol dehydrogenase family)
VIGKVAVVTGGANGIGLAVVEELISQGCAVAIVDREGDTVSTVAQRLRGAGATVLPLTVDVSQSADCVSAVAAAAAELGGIDYLVNSAGSFIAKGADGTDDDWNRSLGVNVRGMAAMVSACVPWMVQRGGGAIVNVSSVSGRVAQTNRWTYNATKGAITSMTRCQALDLAPSGIRVNSVAPGWIWTRELARAAADDRAKWEPLWGRFAMMRRLGDPIEVAKPISFLLGDGASFITGTELAIDGGYLAMGPEGLGDDAVFAGSD